MRFTLYYRGPLKANGKPKDKHALRQHFHTQMKSLWDQEPLTGHRKLLMDPTPPRKPLNLLHEVGPFTFVPLVSARIFMVAELELTMLRPEAPGKIVTQGGDIDNRLKTLLDSLKMPTDEALPSRAEPEADEQPFFCLLEDDHLVTSLSVRSARLLEPDLNQSEVVLLIDVTTRLTNTVMGNVGLGS